MDHFDNFAENDHIRFEFVDGLLVGTFKSGKKIDLDGAKNILKTRLALIDGNSYSTLLKNIGSVTISKEGRDFLSGDEAREGIKATALVADSLIAASLANFFLKVTVQKPKVPTKIFANEEKALAWLEAYK